MATCVQVCVTRFGVRVDAHACLCAYVCICKRIHVCVCIYICAIFLQLVLRALWKRCSRHSCMCRRIRYTSSSWTSTYTSATQSLQSMHICVCAYVYVCSCIYLCASMILRVGVHMHSCKRILFICTIQSLYYMRVYHRCLFNACMHV